MTADLFATVCEAAGAKPEGIDGVSLLADMMGKAQQPMQRDLVWVRREGGAMYAGREFYAFRRGDWKLLQNTAFQQYELYNLANDPEEKKRPFQIGAEAIQRNDRRIDAARAARGPHTLAAAPVGAH